MKRSSLALATFLSAIIIACALFALAIFTDANFLNVDVFLASTDTPSSEGGDGFVSGDPCGFVMGSSAKYKGGQVLFDYMDDAQQGCVDQSGYFYKDTSVHTASKAYHSVLGEIDFAPGPDSTKYVKVNQTTGEWSGYAKITGIPKSAGTKQWVWFNWTCSGCTATDYAKRVRTNLSTGAINGYAWSDYLYATYGDGYILFSGLTEELPPRNISIKVDVLSDDGVFPEDATIDDAPIADGFQYWRVRVQFLDNDTWNYLDESDFTTLSLDLEPTTDSQMYMDHIKNIKDKMSGVKDTPVNLNVVGCETASGYCVETEDDGSTSFNTFVYAGAPTSNMVGIDDDADQAIEYPTDRDGCIWFYKDQWSSTDTSEPTCPRSGGSDYDKDNVFYARATDRNQYLMDYLGITVKFNSSRDIAVDESGSVTWDGNKYVYDFGGEELSFRPRFQVKKFVASYDGTEYTTSISTDVTKPMQLITDATIADFSDEYKAAGGSTAAKLQVVYQLDAVSSSGVDAAPGDLYFLIDSDTPPDSIIDDSVRKDTIGGTTFKKSYKIGYGQKESDCASGCPAPTGNTLSNPTVEQWVCDAATSGDLSFGQASCYFTAYLTILDRHTAAAEMLVLGAINSTIDQNDFFETYADDADYSILGAVNIVNLRNKMYAQIARYTLGQTAPGGTIDLGDNLADASEVVSLINDRFIYAEGDVHVTGGDSGFTDKTLVVVGGDVYIESNITSGKLGIIALKSGGNGGNVYVYPSVTEIYANMYLDGSFFSYSGKTMSDGVTPKWNNDEDRLDALQNQLYLKGSLMSRNTVGGSGDSSYPKGDGSYAGSYDEAVEYDLNMTRQFRQCYDVDTDGTLLTTYALCDEGEKLSTYGETNADYSSFIIEYDPAGDLPIFVVESGLFN